MNNIIYSILNGNSVVVPRNCANMQERWKKVDEVIYKTWQDQGWSINERLSFTDCLTMVMNDPSKNEGLTLETLVEHTMGCGCCVRHSSGIVQSHNNSVQHHVDAVSDVLPTTYTAEGKLCACRCRMLTRHIVAYVKNCTIGA